MTLSDRHLHFLRVEQFVHPFVINLVLNGVIAWAILRGHAVVPLWGETAMGPDLLATGVLLPFLMCEIVSRVVSGQVTSGKLPPLPAHQIPTAGLHRRSVHVRALVLVFFGTACGSLPLVVLLDLANAQPVSFGGFVTFKAVWAGALAAVLSPPLAWWALAAASESAVSEAGGQAAA